VTLPEPCRRASAPAGSEPPAAPDNSGLATHPGIGDSDLAASPNRVGGERHAADARDASPSPSPEHRVMPEAILSSPFLVSRRRLVGGAVGIATGAAVVTGPAGGVFAAGRERLRVGLVGCGGRGTGAAVQAAAAATAVRVVAIGDLFADQVTAAAAILRRTAGDRFACPPEARFVGPDAWRRVIESDIDLVILATPPDCRPGHLAAAVAAGRHVFVETPAAIDGPGAETVAAACARARDRGLAVMSGLAWRRDPPTVERVDGLRGGAIGRLLAARMTSLVGLPWRRPTEAGWTAAESRRRNWIDCPDQSGGDFVERQIHAIDKALWVLGDEDPLAVEPLASDSSGTTAVRLRFASGATLSVTAGRRHGATDVVAEIIAGTRGATDLRQPGVGRHGAAMTALVRGLLSGRRIDDGAILCRATIATLLGRAAAAAGEPLPWPGPTVPLLRSV
jgi:predicted dehydrogenase